MLKLPCPICSNETIVKLTKKKKPYITCNQCGIQLFFRYPKSENLLLGKIKKYEEIENGG